MRLYVLVALGGAVGSIGRFWLATAMARLTGPGFPWGTVLINIAGSFLIGWLASLTALGRVQGADPLRAFAMVGVCGGFTTFSSFSLQTVDLLRDAQYFGAAVNICLSVVICLAATFAGLALGRL
jgi:protein CrcB